MQIRDFKLLFALVGVLLAPACKETKGEKPGSVQARQAADPAASQKPTTKYTGSEACRPCHEKFYQLWEPSHHGRAMQPFSPAFAEESLTFDTEAVTIGKATYQAVLTEQGGYVVEQGIDGETRFEIVHVLGGKNVYYFLTPMKKGRLQVLPIGYNVHKKSWFDVAESGVRHFTDREDAPVHWTDSQYTFNTSCYGCHVSQLAKNYDLSTDTYHTEWREPGINCETCHGPSGEHVEVCANAPKGTVPKDLKIIRGGRDFTPEQNNDTCASCHAKMVPLTGEFVPGEKFFDHFDLVGLEHPDFYPDGRDLGENYTFTTWGMSPCVSAGKLDCLHCHTSSGRFLQKDDPNRACVSCHKDKLDTITEHSRHDQSPGAPTCISCHMPMTTFAHMNRSDHSMAPPVPAATVAFGSPNACNLCHGDKDAKWADRMVTKWHGDQRAQEVLYRGQLVDAARKGDWSRLDDILSFIAGETHDEITRASLIRLLMNCSDPGIIPAVINALSGSSPLIRASAVQALEGRPSPDAVLALLEATKDSSRLVRIRAAAALASLPEKMLKEEHQKSLKSATDEFIASMTARPDDYASHYNLGNTYLNRGEFGAAVDAYKTAAKLRPDALPIWVNLSMAHHGNNDLAAAVESLEQALVLDPQSEAALLNLAMLLGEQGNLDEARKYFAKALKIYPQSAPAAFNLCVLDAEANWKNAKPMCEKAWKLQPKDPKYAYTLAFYQHRAGRTPRAIKTLEIIIKNDPFHVGVYALLAQMYTERSQLDKAQSVYRAGAANRNLPPADRARFAAQLQ